MEKLLFNPWIIVLILLWTLPWKGAALWRAARRGHIGWFLAILILNTLAILDIIYIFFFSGNNLEKQAHQEEVEVRQPTMQPYRQQQIKAKIIEEMMEVEIEEEFVEARQTNIPITKKRPNIV